MERIESPSTDDSSIEREIVAKGLTFPRITPDDLKANIAHVHYFTAREGCVGAAVNPSVYHESLGLLTFCVIVLKNGFTVTGESACSSPENFDPVVGQKIAFENAKQKIWPLMGYLLKEQLKGV